MRSNVKATAARPKTVTKAEKQAERESAFGGGGLAAGELPEGEDPLVPVTEHNASEYLK